MKWLIGPRRIGKTSQLIKSFMDYPGDAVLIGLNISQVKVVFIPLIEEQYPDITVNRSDLTIQRNGRIKYLTTVDNISKFATPNEIKKLPKFIDEAQFILEDMFKNVHYISGTGPNFDWPEDRQFLLKERFAQLDERIAETDDFKITWK